MTTWRSPRQPKPPPAGEYAVFHERPYPYRLDRAFRVGAAVVGGAIFVCGAALAAGTIFNTGNLAGGFGALGGVALMAGLAYAITRAVGMIAVGLYGATRGKEYVVDWHEAPDPARQNRIAWIFWIGFFLLAGLFALADRQ